MKVYIQMVDFFTCFLSKTQKGKILESVFTNLFLCQVPWDMLFSLLRLPSAVDRNTY